MGMFKKDEPKEKKFKNAYGGDAKQVSSDRFFQLEDRVGKLGGADYRLLEERLKVLESADGIYVAGENGVVHQDIAVLIKRIEVLEKADPESEMRLIRKCLGSDNKRIEALENGSGVDDFNHDVARENVFLLADKKDLQSENEELKGKLDRVRELANSMFGKVVRAWEPQLSKDQMDVITMPKRIIVILDEEG